MTTATPAKRSGSKGNSSQNTRVHCECGQTCVVLSDSGPKKAVECCCCDCRNAVIWCYEQRRQHPPKPTKVKPNLLYYFDNDIIRVEWNKNKSKPGNDGAKDGSTTEELFQLMKLRLSGGSLRVVTKCCHSQMMVLHPLYFRNRIMIAPEACGKIEFGNDSSSVTTEPELRMQSKFWDDSKFGPLPPFPKEDVYTCSSPTWPFATGLVQAFIWPFPTQEGFTAWKMVDKYTADCDKESYIIANKPEALVPGHFQTGGGMLSLTLKNPFSSHMNAILCWSNLWPALGVTFVASSIATVITSKSRIQE